MADTEINDITLKVTPEGTDEIETQDTGGGNSNKSTLASVISALVSGGYVAKALFNANTIIAATSDDTPAALTVAEQTLVGRITSGDITALTATEVRTLLNIVEKATLTDNAIPKANGTGGDIQDTGVIITDINNVYGAGVDANVQTGTTYELVLGDAGKLVTLSNASSITLTIPANASVAFAVGTVINLIQLGAGQVTVTITSDTLSSSSSNVKLTGQYSAATLVKIAATTWVLFGDIAA